MFLEMIKLLLLGTYMFGALTCFFTCYVMLWALQPPGGRLSLLSWDFWWRVVMMFLLALFWLPWYILLYYKNGPIAFKNLYYIVWHPLFLPWRGLQKFFDRIPGNLGEYNSRK